MHAETATLESRHAFGWRGLLLLAMALFAAQVLLYHQSFTVGPASDDFSFTTEIRRGSEQGWTSFFTHSLMGRNYRPLKSVGLWWFGNIDPAHREFWIRVLNFLSMGTYAAVALLWIRLLPLGRAGAVVALLAMLFHPVLPAAVGSIDSYDALVSSAFLWLGAWVAFVGRRRWGMAAIGVFLCFAIGSLFKEYTFGLIPLAGLVMLCFAPRRRVLAAAAVCVPLVAGLLVLLYVRRLAVGEGGDQGYTYIATGPREIARNAGLIVSALLFMGNSVWAYVHQSKVALAVSGAAVLGAGAVIAQGIWLRLRLRFVVQALACSSVPAEQAKACTTNRNMPLAAGDSRAPGSCLRRVVFLLLSFVAASFPVNIMGHVSEMYIPPLVLPFALLCGLAADGFARGRPAVRIAATGIGSMALVSAALTTTSKVQGLVDVGRRADDQLHQVMAFIPPTARDQRIALLFRLSEIDPRASYSVYRMGDETLICQPQSLEWLPEAQGRGLRLTPLRFVQTPQGLLVLDNELAEKGVQQFVAFEPATYDIVLRWDFQGRRFERWK